LYQANFGPVFRCCGSILRNAEDAADAAHEVFLTALGSMDPTLEGRRARAWLLTVARNHCLDVLRRKKRFGRALTTLGGDGDPETDLEAAVADRDLIDLVLKQLSFRERLALWQSAVEQRPLADIAAGLRLSYSAAGQVVHRARQRAVRYAASVAAVIMGLRLPRAVRRFLDRAPISGNVGADTLLAAQRVLLVAAVPLIAAVSLQSSNDLAAGPRPVRIAIPVLANQATPGQAVASVPRLLLTIPEGALKTALKPPASGLNGPGAVSSATSSSKALVQQVGKALNGLIPSGTVPSALPSAAGTSVPLPSGLPLPSPLPSASVAPLPSTPPTIP
jgi:RNA polymerase sigma-70 factor (ECF subfamily)